MRAISVYCPGATPENAKPDADTVARGSASAPDATSASTGDGWSPRFGTSDTVALVTGCPFPSTMVPARRASATIRRGMSTPARSSPLATRIVAAVAASVVPG